jgi:acetylornithine deacetylase
MRLLNQLPALLASSLSSHALAGSLQQPLGNSQQSTLASAHGDHPHYRDTLLALHKALIEIPSVTGDENEVAMYLVDYLTDLGLQAELQFLPSPAASARPRFNVLAWPGTSRARPTPRVLVSSHIDTVPPYIPYSATPEGTAGPDTVIAGRGSVDAKASVAAQVTALLDLIQAGELAPDGAARDVLLLFVVGEEDDGAGMRHFSDSLEALDPVPRFDAAIFGEPTEGRLACGHKGFLGCTVKAHGRTGHSGYPWLGKSANEVLMRGLVKVLDTDLGTSERLGNTTVNVGRIDGGVALNVIPEQSQARMAVRIAIGPQETGAQVVKDWIWDALQSVDSEEGTWEMDCINGYGAILCDCDVEGEFLATTISSNSYLHFEAPCH